MSQFLQGKMYRKLAYQAKNSARRREAPDDSYDVGQPAGTSDKPLTAFGSGRRSPVD